MRLEPKVLELPWFSCDVLLHTALSVRRLLNLSITYQPISLFKWQMYAAQGMRQRWYSFLGEDFMEESDEDQDSLKVFIYDIIN